MTKDIFVESFKIKPLAQGGLDGLTFAIKDSINVFNYKSGCGSPLWTETHFKAIDNAVCVDKLLSSGATCCGKTVMGELGCGLTGVNSFFGETPNPRFLSCIPGGSSSGSAAAVAANMVDFSLGTDAGGSIRVPASYCGVFGMRPSQGIISLSGVNYLSPTFDTIGIFANSVDTLQKVSSVLLPENLRNKKYEGVLGKIYILSDCFDLLEEDLRKKFYDYIKALKKHYPWAVVEISSEGIDRGANDQNLGWSNTFKTMFCDEVWNSLGSWVERMKLEFGKTTHVDFSKIKKEVDKGGLENAIKQSKFQLQILNLFLRPNDLLCIPTTPNVAPKRGEGIETEYSRFRKLISISNLGKLPQVSVPLFKEQNPIGISFLGAYKSDFQLLSLLKMFEKKELLYFV